MKHCVVPGWMSCPAATSCSTTSPPIGAFTGTSNEGGPCTSASGSVIPSTFSAACAAARSPLACTSADSRLLQVLLCDGLVLVQILGARIGLLRQSVGILGLQVVGAQLRVIRAGHIQHGFALMHVLSRNDHDPADRPAHLRDDRGGVETVVGHRSGQPQRAGQASSAEPSTTCTCDICSGGMVNSSAIVRILRRSRQRCDPDPLAAGKREQDRQHGGQRNPRACQRFVVVTPVHGRFLVPSASFNCSSAVMYEAKAWRYANWVER